MNGYRIYTQTQSIVSFRSTVILLLLFILKQNRMIVSDANSKQKESIGHLREANIYAKWSEEDRQSKLPTITPEQRQQIHQYLSIIQQHGLSKSMTSQQGNSQEDISNPKCPVLPTNNKATAPTTSP